MKQVAVYTDGACSGNPGPGGWGAILIYRKHTMQISGYEPKTTNNRMELTAAIEALKKLKEPCEVKLYSDSRYLIDGFKKGWVSRWKRLGWMRGEDKPVINPELWQELDRLSQIHTIEWIWVKGHADTLYNELCDKLATEEIRKHAVKR